MCIVFVPMSNSVFRALGISIRSFSILALLLSPLFFCPLQDSKKINIVLKIVLFSLFCLFCHQCCASNKEFYCLSSGSFHFTQPTVFFHSSISCFLFSKSIGGTSLLFLACFLIILVCSSIELRPIDFRL